MKRFFAILLALALMFSLAACGGGDEDKTPSGGDTPPSSSQQEQQPSNTPDPGTSQTGQPTENEKNPEETAEEIASGFGSYNGQPIVWRVLDIDLVNERALLISSDCIDAVLFHETEPTEELTWESSDLRKWLGGEFYDTAFTEEQKGKILEVTNPADTNSESGAQGGNDTTDKVFILSASEMVKYFVDDADMAGTLNGEGISYWTRTPGDSTQGYVCTYSGGGGLYMTGNWATATEVAVRPAIWVNLSDEADAADPGNDDSQPSGGDMADWNYTDYAEYTNGVPEPEFAYTVKGIINDALTLNSEASADEINAWKQTLLDNGAEEVREGDTWAVRDGAHLIEMNGILNGVARIYISLDDTPVSGDGQPEQSDTPDPGTTQTEDNGDVEIKGEAWPENEFTALVPKPRNGVVDAENSTQFGCTISLVMTEEEVAEYAADLIAAGFEGEWNDSAKMYSGKNSEGYKVSLMYNGPTTIFSISKE